jgi:hypothetical protein
VILRAVAQGVTFVGRRAAQALWCVFVEPGEAGFCNLILIFLVRSSEYLATIFVVSCVSVVVRTRTNAKR